MISDNISEIFEVYGEQCVICESEEHIGIHHVYGQDSPYRGVPEGSRPMCGECEAAIYQCKKGYEEWYVRLDMNFRSDPDPLETMPATWDRSDLKELYEYEGATV